jgi:hypothetical protein
MSIVLPLILLNVVPPEAASDVVRVFEAVC